MFEWRNPSRYPTCFVGGGGQAFSQLSISRFGHCDEHMMLKMFGRYLIFISFFAKMNHTY